MKKHESLNKLQPPLRESQPRLRQSLLPSQMLDIVRCPKCRGPMIARMGRARPYFHCLCYEDNLAGVIPATKLARQPSAATAPPCLTA
jgi:hypothetical protein